MNPSDEAAEWFIAQRTGELSAEERERFMRWLGDSAANVREYLAVAELWGALPAAPGIRSAPADLKDALRSLPPVTPLDGKSAPPSRERSRTRTRRRSGLIAAAAACLLAAAGAAVWFLDTRPGTTELITHRGEQRSLELADGSVMQLNALSHVVATFNDRIRHIELRQGEALFHVAKDPARPFEVATPDARVRALGTTFNVYYRGSDTRVAVVEGKVQVLSQAAPVAIAANETVRVASRGRVVSSGAAETQKVTAWTQRRLIFDEEPLARVIAEFNLYNVRQLSVDDEELARFQINGVFDADDPEALVAYLERVKGVAAEKKDNKGIRLRRSTAH